MEKLINSSVCIGRFPSDDVVAQDEPRVDQRLSRDSERRRDPVRNAASHAEEAAGHASVEINAATVLLRSDAERVLLRPASRRVLADLELLPNGSTALSEQRLRAAVRGRARLLGHSERGGRAVLLVSRSARRENLTGTVRRMTYTKHRSTQETLQVLDSLQLDTVRSTTDDVIKKFGWEDDVDLVTGGRLSQGKLMMVIVWQLFEEPRSSRMAKVSISLCLAIVRSVCLCRSSH